MKTKHSSPQLSKQSAAVLVIAIAVALIVGIRVLKWQSAGSGTAVGARTIGNPNAKVKIVEWVDFQCPACAAGAADLKKIVGAMPDKIYLELRFFPLGGHMHALQAAKFGECAAEQQKFWPYVELVFERQPKWRDLMDARPAFDEIAKDIGLNPKALQACLDNDKTREKIFAEKDEGQKLGITSTPTYFVNGKMVVGPKPMREELEKLLGVPLTPPATADQKPASAPSQ